MVEILHESKYLGELSYEERLKALDRLVLAARTRFVLTNTTEAQFASMLSFSEQEKYVRTYLEQGSLPRLTPEQSLLLVMGLVKHCPEPVLPPDFGTPEDLSPSVKVFFEKTTDLLVEAITMKWVSEEIAVQAATDTFVNFKCTKKTYKNFMNIIKQIMSNR